MKAQKQVRMNNSYAKAQEWGFATCLDKGLSQGEQESPRINRSLLFLELQPLHALVSSRQLRELSSSPVGSRQLPWALVNSHVLSSTFERSRQLSCALVNFRGLSSSPVSFRPLPWALVKSRESSSSPVSFSTSPVSSRQVPLARVTSRELSLPLLERAL